MDEKTKHPADYSQPNKESRKDYWDYYSTVTTAEKKGHAEGRAEGLAEGMEKGLAEGMEKGEAKGKTEVARNMKSAGMSLSDIAKFTGLTEDEISKL